jgi:meso-butanediol dehydrogenase / (S,S)-butanediol dehydrogenase / diacetyl reductase
MAESDMRVLVTGGASGIGAAIARRFVDDGAQVAVLDRDQQAMNDLDRAIPGVVLPLRGDVTDVASVEHAFAELDRAWGGLDVVFNNAGISIRAPFLDTTLSDWERVIAVNLTGVFLVTQRAARRMTAGGGGVIINIASVSGMVGIPNYASYNVSKAGVIELTKTLALELAPAIRVNAICPGYVLTPMQETEYTAKMLHDCESRLPLKRLAHPAEIAGLGAYLAGPEARFITGQSFVIDGGESAGGLASGL